MNKKILLGFFMIALLVLTSCQFAPRAYSGPQTTDFYSGTQGITAEFLRQAPPDEVFETSDFDVQLYVKNLGAFSLVKPYAVKVDLTYDAGKAESVDSYKQDSSFLGKLFDTPPTLKPTSKAFAAEGKSANWPQGESQYVSLARLKAKEIVGNFQTIPTAFIAQICYPYETNFADEFCIDTDTEGTSQRQEVCEKEDKTYGRGQGAPIAVVAVESQMVPRGIYVQPQFTLHLEHKGMGTVSFRDIKDESYDISQCDELQREDINKISVDVSLAGDKLNCLPNEVIFKNGKAKIQCQLVQDKILGVSSNYRTTLMLKATYLYSESFRKDIVVHKSQGTSFEDAQDSDIENCFAWQELDRDTKKCVDICDYKAKYHREFTSFEKIKKSIDSIQNTQTKEILWNQTSCIYPSITACKDNPDFCVSEPGLCQPGYFCGLPSCLKSNNAPQISKLLNSGTDRISFYCTDSDDTGNLQRACGCTNTAEYGFVEKNIGCSQQAAYTQTAKGTSTDTLGMRFYIEDLDNAKYENKTLCIKVTDTLDKSATRSLAYPYNVK